MFGPSLSIGAYKKPVEDTPDKWRRSVYLQTHRTVRHPTLSLFDPPDSERSAQVRRAYQLALSRPPREDEFDFSVTVIQNGTLTDFCHVLLGLNEFIYVH